MTPPAPGDSLKAQLWATDTVTIRKVLRRLNNQRRTIEATTAASIRHEPALRHIITNYSHVEVAKALAEIQAAIAATPAPDLPPTGNTRSRGDMDDIINELSAPPPPTRYTFEAEPPKVTDEFVNDPKPERDEINWASLSDADDGEKMKILMQLISTGVTEKKLRKILESYTPVTTHNTLRDALNTFRDNHKTALTTLEAKLTQLQDLVLASNAVELTVTTPDRQEISLGTVHKDTPRLIKFLGAGLSVFLTGPSGSGKSVGAEKAAEALDLAFYSLSVCSQTTKTEILGYMDATGVYRRTQFRDAYENGGVFLFDEIDAGNANVLAVLNNALSGKRCPFPDGMILRHDKFRCVAAGNTWGTGRTMQYVGRNALDAATMNRFAVIYWDYDEALESKLANLPKWSQYVQACRAEVKRRGVQVLVTPRASIYGAALLRAGVSIQEVIDTVLFPNIDAELKKQLPPAPSMTEESVDATL